MKSEIKEIIIVREDGSQEKIERGVVIRTDVDCVAIEGRATKMEIAAIATLFLKEVCNRGLQKQVEEILDGGVAETSR